MTVSAPPDRWVPLSSVELGPEEIRLAEEAIRTGWISSTGPNVPRFEALLAERAGRSGALAVSNGTVALELVLRALGIGPGDEVIVPALTFVAPAATVATVGALPVFADVTAESWTLDPAQLGRLRTPRTRAVIPVDVLGHPADYDAIAAALPGVAIIEDAAEAHGARYRGRPVGAMGIAGTFSFHANKTISTGEGGAIVGDDEALLARMRLLMNHGMTKERPYHHEVVGHNFRMTNVTAAIGVGQVGRWAELTAARNALAARYDAALAGLPGWYRRPVAAWGEESVWLYAIGIAGGRRARVLESLRNDRIDARAIWPALCDLPPYGTSCRAEYPVARRLAAEVLWLPTSAAMTDDQVERVTSAMARALRE